MSDALDPLPLLRALHERGIEHIVVGGFAVNAHGFIRVTKDLDIVPSSGQSNLGRLAEISGVSMSCNGSPGSRPTISTASSAQTVRVCSLEHLRAMKRAAGRPQDLEDLKRLGEDQAPSAAED